MLLRRAPMRRMARWVSRPSRSGPAALQAQIRMIQLRSPSSLVDDDEDLFGPPPPKKQPLGGPDEPPIGLPDELLDDPAEFMETGDKNSLLDGAGRSFFESQPESLRQRKPQALAQALGLSALGTGSVVAAPRHTPSPPVTSTQSSAEAAADLSAVDGEESSAASESQKNDVGNSPSAAAAAEIRSNDDEGETEDVEVVDNVVVDSVEAQRDEETVAAAVPLGGGSSSRAPDDEEDDDDDDALDERDAADSQEAATFFQAKIDDINASAQKSRSSSTGGVEAVDVTEAEEELVGRQMPSRKKTSR